MTLTEKVAEAINDAWTATDGLTKDDKLTAMAEAAIHTVQHHDSIPVQAEDAITALRKSAEVIRMQLAGAVMAACPGPHRPVQHRDGKPAWCPACRYTSDGERVDPPPSLGPIDGAVPVGTNTGHGHVWERPDGVKYRCGGPGICAECSRDQQLLAGGR